MKVIDLRSDTVTLPTPAMRTALSAAELGDDVFEEDPTTKVLESMAAELVGMEAALLVPSGTMGNLTSILTHCARGEEVILGNLSHTFVYEAGGMAALGGIHPHTLPNLPDGTLLLDDIAQAIRTDNEHFPRTRLICLENTHNLCNGSPLSPAYIDDVASLAKIRGLSVHMDGARLFNAAVALQVDVKALTRHVDSLSFCLSKGLAAPVGSLVCGSREFIIKARRTRKLLGGGMRQCGIIAAAGIVALEEMIGRLAEDHAHAQRLAEGISHIAGLTVQPDMVKTNIVYFSLDTADISADDLVTSLKRQSIQFLHTGNSRFRMVTHYGISAEDIDTTLSALSQAMP